MHELTTHLSWDGTRGIARFSGVTLELDRAPRIGEHMRFLDYTPAIRVAQVRESARVWRRMTAAECAEADALLAQMEAGARAPWAA